MAIPNQIVIDSPTNTVEIQTNDNQLTIISEVCNTEVTVTQPVTTTIQVAALGPKGDKGDPGAALAIVGNINNRVLTATGGETINGEANLTFNGSDLSVAGNVSSGNTVDTVNLTVNGFVTTNLSPNDNSFGQTLGESTRTWNQVHVGTSDGLKTAFFGEDLANNPTKLFIRTDNSLTIRGQQGITMEGATDIASLTNGTLTNSVLITTPLLTATNLTVTNSASIGGNFTPTADLHISGANADTLLRVGSPSSPNALFVSGSGRVGIGTGTPTNTLQVAGTSSLQNIIFDTNNIYDIGTITTRARNIWSNGIIAGASGFFNNLRSYLTLSVGANTDFTNSATLHVSGASNANLLRVGSPANDNILFVSGSGLIGIKTTTPAVELDVIGQIRASGTMFNSTTQTNTIQLSSATNLRFLSASVETARYDNNGWGFFNTAPTAKVHISGANNDSLFRIQSPASSSIIFVTGSGLVGVGTLTPTQKISVDNGNVGFTSGFGISWDSDTEWIRRAAASDQLQFATQNTVRLNIGSTQGQLVTIGLGATTGTAQFQVRGGGATAASTAMRIEDSGGNARLTILDDGTSAFNISHLYVSSSGNVGIGTTTPFTLGGNARLSVLVAGNNIPFTYGISDSDAIYLRRQGLRNYQFQSSNNNGNIELNPYGGTVSIGMAGVTSSIKLHISGASSDSLLRLSSPANDNILFVSGSGNVGIGTTTPSASLHVEGNFQISTGSLYTYGQNTDIDSGSFRTVMTVSTSSYRAAFFDYVLTSGSNARAGTVFSVWHGTSVEYADTSTNDIGNTTGVNLLVSMSGANIGLFASSSNDNWSMKALARMI